MEQEGLPPTVLLLKKIKQTYILSLQEKFRKQRRSKRKSEELHIGF
jgi:hypothetical protein